MYVFLVHDAWDLCHAQKIYIFAKIDEKKLKKKENELPSSILSSFSWETWAFCKATIFSYIRKKTVDFVHNVT